MKVFMATTSSLLSCYWWRSQACVRTQVISGERICGIKPQIPGVCVCLYMPCCLYLLYRITPKDEIIHRSGKRIPNTMTTTGNPGRKWVISHSVMLKLHYMVKRNVCGHLSTNIIAEHPIQDLIPFPTAVLRTFSHLGKPFPKAWL